MNSGNVMRAVLVVFVVAGLAFSSAWPRALATDPARPVHGAGLGSVLGNGPPDRGGNRLLGARPETMEVAGLMQNLPRRPLFIDEGESRAFENPAFQGVLLAQQRPAPQRSLRARPPSPAQPQPEDAQKAMEEMGNPARPKSGEVATEPFFIDFDDIPLLQVIDSIGLKTGRNFEVDPGIGAQKVTIISHHAVPPEMAYAVLESILASRNMVMLETLDGNLVKIVPRAKNTEKLEIWTDGNIPTEGFDNFSIHIVNVEYADANEVASLLKAVGSQASDITVYTQTNMLVISDTADGIRNMFRLLEVIDVKGYDTSMEIFTIEYTRAELLAQQIQEVLVETAGGPKRPTTPTRVPVRASRAAAAAGQRAPTVIGQQQAILRMVPDERLNALIVVASEPLMEQVRDLIDKLDRPTPYEANNMHFVELLNADVESVEEALKAITGTTPRKGTAQGGAPSGEVQPFEKTVTITRYDPTNSLVIVASPQDFKVLKQVIDLLDVARRQVNVEAIIMEVTITDRFELSVEAAGLTANDAFSLNNVINIATGIAGGPLALAGAGVTVGIIDGVTQIPLPTTVDSSGNLSGLTLQTIPNVPLLLRALETVTDLEVLSQPNLLTRDNEEASIVVGQQIPVISSLSDTDDRSGFISRSRVQRQDVGVKMTVTPQINEGDYVSMALNVEVSSPVLSTLVLQSDQIGPTFNIAELTSEVIVRDGQTGIIGGLLSEQRDRSISQPPFLGDLPLLGWLFRAKSSARKKNNLVVLVTPHIIKEGHDMERVTDYRVRAFYRQNLDVLFGKHGYIKKIKTKHRLRNRYRPTERFNPDAEPQKGFGRGDITR